MTNYILIICSVIITYELLNLVKFRKILNSNIIIYKKMYKIFIFNKVSDSRKQKLVFNYSKMLIITSIKILVLLSLIIIFNLILNLFFNSYINFLISILGIIQFTLIFIIYHTFRKNK